MQKKDGERVPKIDGGNAMIEAITAIKRAGADKVITYYAKKLARILNNET